MQSCALRGLLHEDSPVQDLDLRGNGLTREDASGPWLFVESAGCLRIRRSVGSC